MLATEMDARWGEAVAQAMRAFKQNDEKLAKEEIRQHPDLPQKEALRLRLRSCQGLFLASSLRLRLFEV